MRKKENRDRPSGYLGLFLMVLVLHGLAGIGHHASQKPFTDRGSTFVQAAGDVRCAGVYAFKASPGLMELVERAGGLKGKDRGMAAGKDAVFRSGERVFFRNQGGTTSYSLGEMSAFYKITLGIPISLNRETETGLTALPGVGPGLARAIITERSRRGGFSRLEDVVAVKGVGPRLFRKIAPMLQL